MNNNALHYPRLLEAELQAVEELLRAPHPDVPAEFERAIAGVIAGGGKRLRPALVLLTAHLCRADLERARYVAASVEMLHTATLIHDDLIDKAQTRRGVQTLNAHLDAAATVLSGDMAFAWAAQLATGGRSLPLMERFSETLQTICAGELHQMANRHAIPTRAEYDARIFAKTASLFALCTEAGAILAEVSLEERAAPLRDTLLRDALLRDAPLRDTLWRFGKALGLAFQIADDVLDFMSDEQTLGKPSGSDLRQGLATLPLMLYLDASDPHTRQTVTRALAQPGKHKRQIAAIIAEVQRSGAAEQAMAIADARIQEAIAELHTFPATPYRAALEEIAAYAVRRRY